MNGRDHVHVAACSGELPIGGGFDVLAGARRVVGRFRVQTDVEVRIEARLCPGACCFQHGVGTECSAKHLEDLAHRHSRVRSDRQQCGACSRWRFVARHAQEVPRRVLDVVGVDAADGTISKYIARRIAVTLEDVKPSLSREEAIAIALRVADYTPDEQDAQLEVYVEPSSAARQPVANSEPAVSFRSALARRSPTRCRWRTDPDVALRPRIRAVRPQTVNRIDHEGQRLEFDIDRLDRLGQ